MKVINLRTMHQHNPVGFMECPWFSWMIESTQQDTVQKSYCLQVYDQGKLVWDSGEVMSEAQNFVSYEGPELNSRTRYDWQVSVKDNYGNSAAATTYFETGLKLEDWQAKWVESGLDRMSYQWFSYGEQPAPIWFKKTFKISGNIRSARLYTTAHGVYKAYVNGQVSDDREFAPEHTVYDKILYYQTYDVTQLLKPGENELAFYVADGWYLCPQTHQEVQGFTALPAILYQLEITYEDGTGDLVISDGKEVCGTGKLVYADIFLGEKRDDTLKEDISMPVKMGDFELNNLVGQPVPPVRTVGLLPAVNVYESPKGEKIVDFGQVICGRARIFIDEPKGRQLTFEYFEVPDKDGNYINTMIAHQRDIYISDGSPCTYEAMFTYHGFRYIRVRGMEDVRKEDFMAVVLTSDKENLAGFSCSDWRLNRLYENVRWSQLNNTLSVPTDCPSREKGGFTGDIQIYARTALLNENMTPFLSGWLNNVTAAQGENGSVPITVPETAPYKRLMIHNAKMFGDEWPVGVAGWGDAAVIVPYEMYQVTGNLLILKRQYESMRCWCDYIIRTAAARCENPDIPPKIDQYLWNTGFHFGEWLIPNEPANMTHEQACRASAFYTAPIFGYISIHYMQEIAGILGRTDDERYYAKYADKIRWAIENSLMKDGLMPTQNMGAYVLVIAFDLVPEHLKPLYGNKLVSLLDENHRCLNTGFLATPYILDALVKIGRKDLAIDLLWQNQMPSWLYEVEKGATAIWESWDAVAEDGTPHVVSYDHYAFGCVDDWISREIAGIDLLEPGFKHIRIAPQPQLVPLDFCEREFVCEYGKIYVRWDKEHLSVKIPCNTKATIEWKGQTCTVGSGIYEF